MIYIGNAFSLGMLEPSIYTRTVTVKDLSLGEVKEILDQHMVRSCVGHQTTAVLFSTLLDHYIPSDRISVFLKSGDVLIIGQYSGPRLEEGTMELPPGASIRWMMVEV